MATPTSTPATQTPARMFCQRSLPKEAVSRRSAGAGIGGAAGGELSPYLADDLYADPQGQVYRRSEEGWSRHEDDGWSTMADLERQYGVQGPEVQQPEGGQRQAYRQNQDDIERMERYYDRRSKSYHMYSNIYVRR